MEPMYNQVARGVIPISDTGYFSVEFEFVPFT